MTSTLFTVVPTVPAPGETDLMDAGGSAVVPVPFSVTVTRPVGVTLSAKLTLPVSTAAESGVNVADTIQVDSAGMIPPQLSVAPKFPVSAVPSGAGTVWWFVTMICFEMLVVPTFWAANVKVETDVVIALIPVPLNDTFSAAKGGSRMVNPPDRAPPIFGRMVNEIVQLPPAGSVVPHVVAGSFVKSPVGAFTLMVAATL
jgi:hypothetical protein